VPGPGPTYASRAGILARRTAPLAALVAVFLFQTILNVDTVVVFPLYLGAVLMGAILEERLESFAVAGVAVLALLFRPLMASGHTSEIGPAVLLSAVTLGVGTVVNELTRHSRSVAAAAQQRVVELSAAERSLRATLESAGVGLALAGLNGNWLEVNQPLALILGRSRDELFRTTLAEVTADGDQAALRDGLALLRSRDVMSWSADVHVVRPDGAVLPSALLIARLPNPPIGDAMLLVQVSDISARERAQSIANCVAAVRQVIVSSSAVDAAMPQLLEAFSGYLGWSVAQ